MTNRLAFVLVLLLILVGGVVFFYEPLSRMFFRPTDHHLAQQGLNAAEMIKEQADSAAPQIEVVAENLDIPWEITFLTDGSLLVTERPGALVRILPESKQKIPVEGVEHFGEGGLLGLALHPQFASNERLYLYLTTKTDNGLTNRVERYRFDQETNTLSEKTTILADIPGAQFHDGGRIAFGPDGMLYVTTGDAGDEQSAQEIDSVAGKILRLTDDGNFPADNPFASAVYSYGHRNPQGIAWDSEGRLWSTEHGPSAFQTGNDELNYIQPGKNYGWPTIKGQQTREGMVTPIVESGRSETWAPAGAVIVNDTLFFAGLRGESLYSIRIVEDDLVDLKAHFTSEYGRLRTVVLSPDEQWLYFATSNTDGRGAPTATDDRIVRVSVSLFE